MVYVFKILWPKYMLYFLYFNNKIQYNQSCTTTTRPVQSKVTMSCHTTYKVGLGYCTKCLIVCIQQK